MPVKLTPSGSQGSTAGSVTPGDTQINPYSSMARENKEKALLRFWGWLCSFFRPEQKADVLMALRNLICPSQDDGSPAVPGSRMASKGALDAFQSLRALSYTPEVFVAKLTTELSGGEYIVHVKFSINKVFVGKTDYFCHKRGGIVLSGFDLRDVDLTGARLKEADLTGVNLRGHNLGGYDLTGADLTGADLTGANLTGAVLHLTDLIGATLTGANLTSVNLRGGDLTDASLSYARLTCGDLTGTWLRRANLRGVDLAGADLTNAWLRGADLTSAVLRNVDLTTADLRNVNLTRAALRDAKLTCTRVGGAKYDGVLLTKENISHYFPGARDVDSSIWEIN